MSVELQIFRHNSLRRIYRAISTLVACISDVANLFFVAKGNSIWLHKPIGYHSDVSSVGLKSVDLEWQSGFWSEILLIPIGRICLACQSEFPLEEEARRRRRFMFEQCHIGVYYIVNWSRSGDSCPGHPYLWMIKCFQPYPMEWNVFLKGENVGHARIHTCKPYCSIFGNNNIVNTIEILAMEICDHRCWSCFPGHKI